MANQCDASLPIQLQLDRGGDLGCSLQLHLCLSPASLPSLELHSLLPLFIPVLSPSYLRDPYHLTYEREISLSGTLSSPVPLPFPN